jgi:hypothetical protein
MSVGRALVVISSVGLLSVVRIADELAKSLGLSDVRITSERGGGRVVAMWECSDDVASEVQRTLSNLPSDVIRMCEVFVTFNSWALPVVAFEDES